MRRNANVALAVVGLLPQSFTELLVCGSRSVKDAVRLDSKAKTFHLSNM